MFAVRPQAGPGPADDFWYGPIGGSLTTASGASVSTVSAMRLSVVFACVRVLSEAVAKLPVRLYKGEFDEVTDHPVARLLRRMPNPSQTSFTWRQMMQAHLSLRSNAFSRIVYRGADVAGLVPLHPDRTTVEQVDDLRWRYRYVDWRGREQLLLQDEVLHLKSLTLDGFTGLSTISAQADGIGTALSAQQYAGRFFKNGAKHAGSWIEYPGKFADGAAERFRNRWRQAYSGENAFTTPVLDQGMKLHELGMTNEDAQFIESRKYSDADLARMFGVPQHMVGILDRSTNNNIEQQSREFYNVTLMGLLRLWEESLESALLSEAEQDAGLRIEFDTDELLRADLATRGKVYHDAVLDGWMTRNEVRERERMRPLTNLDAPLEPMNMHPAGAEPPAGAAPPAAAERESALVRAAADRCVVREVNAITKLVDRHGMAGTAALEAVADFYEVHAEFVAKALVMDASVVARVCEARFDELRENDVRATLRRWQSLGGALLLEMIE